MALSDVANCFKADYQLQYPDGDVAAMTAKVDEFALLFNEVDGDSGGDLDIEEATKAMEQQGHSHTREELIALLARVDDDHTGTLDLREFLNLMLLECEFIAAPVEPNGGKKQKKKAKKKAKKKGKLKHNQAIVKKKRGHLKLSTEIREKGDGAFELSVHIDKAQDLLPCDLNGLSDPYVKLYVLPGSASSGAKGESKQKTKTIKKSLDPTFDEAFIWPFASAADLEDKRLHVTVWDWDRLTANDFMGGTSFKLSEIMDEQRSTSGWFILLDEAQSQLHHFPSRLEELSNASVISKSTRLKDADRPQSDPSKKLCVDDFQYLKVLGQGSFGKVLLSQRKDTNEVFAVKVLKKMGVVESEDVSATMMEKEILTMNNPFLVHCVGTFQSPGNLYFVMQLVQGGDLMNRCATKGKLSLADTAFYTAEICLGLFYLHSIDIIHRDLKLENVMLDAEGHVKITDFGLAKQLAPDEKARTFCGTPQYLAPEIIRYRPYSKECDFWSLGVMVFEMINGYALFDGEDMESIFEAICRMKIHVTKPMAGDCGAFFKKLLNRNPRRRLGAGETGEQEIREDPFFSKLSWDDLAGGKVKAPWAPKLKNQKDTGNFDKTFTKKKAAVTMVKKDVTDKIDQSMFDGFSYVEQSPVVSG